MSPPFARSAGGPGSDWGRSADEVHIDRLALRVAGLNEDTARSLARLVAMGLTPGLLRSAGGAGLDSLQVEVTAGGAEGDDLDALARRIITGIGQGLARDRTAGGPDGEASS